MPFMTIKPLRQTPPLDASGGGIVGKMKCCTRFILPEMPRGEAEGRGAAPLLATDEGKARQCA